MIASSQIKLRYSNAIWIKSQWFLLYEFEIMESKFFEKSDEQILKSLIGSRIVEENLFHSEMEGREFEVAVQHVARPFEFDKLSISDFQFIASKKEFEEWLIKFRTDDWEDDREDAQILIDKAEKELWLRTKIETGVWHLSKNNFETNSDKLIDIHWIYGHFETFIDIDRKNKLIRTFDFGYD